MRTGGRLLFPILNREVANSAFVTRLSTLLFMRVTNALLATSRFKIGKSSLLLFSFLPFLLSAFAFHPFHTSLTQMEFDPKSQTFEVSVRVFTDDFETVLTKENGGKPIHLNAGQKHDKLIEQYVRKHFVVASADRKPLPITYVGYEQEADAQWVYFEMPFAGKAQNVFIKQDLFIDIFADQVNLVTIQLNQVKKTVVFRNNQPVQAVTL